MAAGNGILRDGRHILDVLLDSDDSNDGSYAGFDASDIPTDIPDFNESDIDVSSVSDVSSVGSLSDSENEDDAPDNDAWTPRFSAIVVDDFQGHGGANLPNDFDPVTAVPLDYFWLLFTQAMLSEITRHTNRYARWKIGRSGRVDPYWVETTDSEIRAYIGMNILMGINTLPSLNMYWSKDPYIRNAGIADIMTINRYQKLNQYFHISDREAEPGRQHPDYDRLYKVRPVLDHVARTFLTNYTLGRELAVDEAMIRYTGRLSIRQYMPAKPVKRGIKIWMCCDSNTAYLSRFEVYLGQTNNQTEHGLGYNVVTRLTNNLHGSKRRIFFDNFFTGVELVQYLHTNGLYGCGTVRVNRKGFPAELKKPRDIKNRGEYKVLQKGHSNLVATVWKDKRLVYHLSTMHDPQDVRDAQRRNGNAVLQLRQPATVHSYNKFMGGVDLHDQLRMNYEVGRNGKKWWRYLFWFFVNCSIVNSFLIYKEVSRRTMKKKRYCHLDFRMELARQLIAGHATRKRRASALDDVPVDQENVRGHILTNLKTTLGQAKGRCRFHWNHMVPSKRVTTVFGCAICNVHLCKDCHGRFHNL